MPVNPGKKVKALIAGKQPVVTLDDYIAMGGQAKVFKYKNMACKIYHDPKDMIPEQKILELRALDRPNILGPKDVIYDPKKKKPIGFTMPYISDTEFLIRICSRKFKKENGITPEMAANLVKHMQETLIYVHSVNGSLVGDYNEMNFLTDKKYQITYNIDVDSYKTKNFNCDAISPSVRDRLLPFGQFNELSDWFSWAVVTFRLYTGLHPFNGNHPDFENDDLEGRMEKSISVFDKDVKLVKSLRDFEVYIPPKHLDWYKLIFIKNERSVPPFADGSGLFVGAKPVAVISSGGLIVDVVYKYDDAIIDVYNFNQKRYVITTKAIYQRDTEIFTFTQKPKNIRLANVLGGEPIIAVKTGENVGFFDLQRKEISRTKTDSDIMECNGSIYTIYQNEIVENTFDKMGRVIHLPRAVGNIVGPFQMFTGLIIQDCFGKAMFSIPYEHKMCSNVNIPELDGYRIIDAKRIGRFCIVIGEKDSKFDRFVFYFRKEFTTYELRGDQDINYQTVNFMVNQKGMAVTVKEENTLELFYNINANGFQEVKDSPVELDMHLYDGVDRILFVNDNQLQSVKSK